MEQENKNLVINWCNYFNSKFDVDINKSSQIIQPWKCNRRLNENLKSAKTLGEGGKQKI